MFFNHLFYRFFANFRVCFHCLAPYFTITKLLLSHVILNGSANFVCKTPSRFRLIYAVAALAHTRVWRYARRRHI